MLSYKQWLELGVDKETPPENFPLIKHLDAQIDVDFKNKSLSLVVKYNCQKFRYGEDIVSFDGIDFDFDYVKVNNKNSKFDYDGRKLVIFLDKKIGGDFEISVSYKVKPKLGFYFIQNEDYLECWTQGEARDNKHWLLCIDYPNQKFTANITVVVPKDYTALANGRLSEVKTHKNTNSFIYKMDWPLTSYLVAVACGKFEKHCEKVDNVTLNYYYPPSLKKLAENSFKETPKILRFFNEKIKYKYPYDSYSQVVITSFMYGGMENTTATFLTEYFMFDDSIKEFLEEYARGLIAHEFAHQWWGDILTCKNWKHIWLNESFATYWDALYTQHQYGQNEFQYKLVGGLESYLEEAKIFQRPIVPPDFVDPSLMFDRHTYPKGALVLHTLRNYVGDEIFFDSLSHYINKNQHRCVETIDLIKSFEEVAGKDLSEFFDIWVFKPGHPQLELNSSWEQKNKIFTIKLTQTQDTNIAPIYKLNLPVKFYSIKNDKATLLKEDIIHLTSQDENFYFKLAQEPSFFEIDPDFTCLKTLKVNYSLKVLNNILDYSTSYYTYYLFLDNISSIPYSQEVIEKIIQKILNKNVFSGIKILLVKALEKFPAKYVEERLRAIYDRITGQKVKYQIIQTLSTFKSGENYLFFKDILTYEKSPYILGAALNGIASIDFSNEEKKDAIKTIKRYLNYPSTHNIVSMHAYGALGKFRDENQLTEFCEGYKKAKHRYIKAGIINGLSEYSVYDNYISEKALFYLKKFLCEETDISVRNMILATISKFNAEKVIPILTNAVANELYSPNKITARKHLEILKLTDRKQDIDNIKKDIEKLKFENKLLKEKVESLEQKFKK
ncbi:MAG: M1 family aminopeptidase [Planctomycetota bacterium]